MSEAAVGALASATALLALALIPVVGELPRLPPITHPDAVFLRDAGWMRGLRRWEQMRGLLVLAAAAGWLLFGLPWLAIAAGVVAPSVWVRLRAEEARARSRRGLGRVIASVEAALRSGVSLPEALRRSLELDVDPLTTADLRNAVRQFELGSSLDAALTSAGKDARHAGARLALSTLALGIAERLPRERLADLLAVVADRLTFEEQLDEEVRARAAGARQQQRLLALLVPAMAAYLALTMPTLATTLGSDLGRFVLIPAAASLEVAGIVLGRRIVRGAVR